MNLTKKVLAVATAYVVAVPGVQAVETDFYGSLRLAFESVNSDDTSAFDDYTGFRDAYSRIGGIISTEVADGVTGSIKLELPLDLANGKQQRPDKADDDLRVFKAQLSGDFGTLWIGKDWMPFYNAIAYPVDYFNSYYSGFATTTTTRVPDTIAYASPDLNGFSFAGSFSKDAGSDDRTQFTASYKVNDKLSVAAGIDDPGDVDLTVHGLAVTYNNGPWYLAAKVERFSTDRSAGYGKDGDTAAAAIAQYTTGKHTYTGLVGQFDGFGEQIFHAGYAYQYKPNVKFFAEYYDEEETAAIGFERKSTLDEWPGGSGGNVLTAGVRYDF